MSDTMGVSGEVQYDLDITCHGHENPQPMYEIEAKSDKGNAIVECIECPRRRAVKVQVRPLRNDP